MKAVLMATMAMMGAGMPVQRNDVISMYQDTPTVNYNYYYQSEGWGNTTTKYIEIEQMKKGKKKKGGAMNPYGGEGPSTAIQETRTLTNDELKKQNEQTQQQLKEWYEQMNKIDWDEVGITGEEKRNGMPETEKKKQWKEKKPKFD